jgi:hypothetical protein
MFPNITRWYLERSDSFQKGFGVAKQAEAVHKVMLALGYNEYGMFNRSRYTFENY